MKKLTEVDFKKIKRSRWITPSPKEAAKKFGVSLKTVLQVRGSKNYQQYQEQNKAQHPPVKYSIADNVKDLHAKVFGGQDDYRTPTSARRALEQLKSVSKEMKQGVHAADVHKAGL